jgi:hypothetical protein
MKTGLWLEVTFVILELVDLHFAPQEIYDILSIVERRPE